MIILIIPMSIGLFTYVRTVSVVQSEVTNTNLAILNQSKAVLDRRLDEVQHIATQMLQNQKLMAFQHVKNPYYGTNVNRVLELEKTLLDYSISNNFIFDYFIFFEHSDLVMSANRTYKASSFYSNNFQYAEMDYESWRRLMLHDYHQREYFPAELVTWNKQESRKSMILYVQSLGRYDSHHGVLMVLIEEEDVRDLLTGLDLSDEGWAYIADQSGRIITQTGPVPEQVQDQVGTSGKEGVIVPSRATNDMMLTYTTSSHNGWSYVAGQPANIALQKVNYIKEVTYYVITLSMVIGVLIAYGLAYRNSKPIRNILNALVDTEDGGSHDASDAYGFIERSVSRLIENNQALQGEVERQAPMLRAAFLDRWLKGELVQDRDAELQMKHIGLELDGSCYVAAVIQIKGFESRVSEEALSQLDRARVVVKEVVRSAIEGRGYLQDIDGDKLAMILKCTHDGEGRSCEGDFRLTIEEIHAKLKQHIETGFILAIGNMYDHWSEVSLSYEEAKQALYYSIREIREGVRRFDELPNENKGYYFPAEVETRLMNHAKTGHEGEGLKLLDEIYRINTERALSLPLFRLLVHDLWGCIVKLTEEIRLNHEQSIGEILEMISIHHDSFEDQAKRFDGIVETYRHLCRIVNQRKKSRNSELAEGILQYIQENYARESLSLASLSERFQLSEVYMSQFFKEQTGTNFFEYLESLRMEYAMKFLKETSETINDIAATVGYNSASTFRRAFKRVHGISPTDYRNSLKA